MEGMASYMAKDEIAARQDVPARRGGQRPSSRPVTRGDFDGFFAYRFGHAVFDFVEERWGKEGFLDFIYEIRNTIGAPGGPGDQAGLQDRAGGLRHRVPPLAAQEVPAGSWCRPASPRDFGARLPDRGRTTGRLRDDLARGLALRRPGRRALGLPRQDRRRPLRHQERGELLRNLTRGFSSEYQYLIAQELTIGRTTRPRPRLLAGRQHHRRLRQARAGRAACC